MSRLARVVLLSSALAWVGCNEAGPSADKARTEAAPSAAKDAGKTATGAALVAPTSKAIVATMKFSKTDVPKAIKLKGTLTRGLRFGDANGDNFVLFSKKAKSTEADGGSHSEYLYVQHFTVVDGTPVEMRLVKDKVEKCEFDLLLAVDKKSLAITDLDNDGMGEVVFGYEHTCTSDVSPAGYKLLLLEGGDKYIIRGTTKLDLPGDGLIGGNRQIDKSLKNGPKVFLDHLKKRWKKLTYRSMN